MVTCGGDDTGLRPRCIFRSHSILGRAARDRRYALLNNEFAVHYLNGRTERRVLTTAAEMREILQGPIGLTLPAGPELDNALHLLSVSSNA